MPTLLKAVRAILSIFATRFFFLIFAQFAFLEWVDDAGFSASSRAIMGAMGLVGFAASLYTARLLTRVSAMVLMRWGFGLCALTAAATPLAVSWLGLMILSAFIGLGLGILTVSLASGLTGLTGKRGFGLQVGLGAGLAYLACNLPVVFEALPVGQSLMAALVCLFGLLVNLRPASYEETCVRSNWPGLKLAPFVAVLLALMILIWMDSGLFYVIQHTPEYKAATWAGSLLWVNGFIHFAFAVAAGWLIDRGALWSLMIAACALLCTGAALLLDGAGHAMASSLYAAGVSLYSTVLVAWPSLNPTGNFSRQRRAGWLYGVAGWVGSAMGIGMVQDLHRIPLWFLAAACTLILAVWIFHEQSRRSVGLVSVLLLVITTMACQVHAEKTPSPNRAPDPEKGMQVYLQEGCINCHSQYVRPQTRDEEWWGPYQSPQSLRESRPPLFGNRRQGPDLLNVGNRRSAQWQKLHLMEPALLNKYTTMPSFAHLFRDERGMDLLAYLESLGSDTIAERMNQVQSWKPNPQIQPGSKERARNLYLGNCATCHGQQGRGEGPAASRFTTPVRNLRQEPFRFVNPQDPAALARIIKFGVLGTNMPGHETLKDEDVLALVRYIEDWRQKP